MREPDLVIGNPDDPYLLRWYIIPRNRFFNIYLHNMKRSDEDRALHDHPWWNVSIVLKGGFWEIKPAFPPHPTIARIYGATGLSDYIAHSYQSLPTGDGHTRIWRGPGNIVFRRATDAHRLELPFGDTQWPRPSWSLFITGPKIREWGLWCPKGWISHKESVVQENGVSNFGGCE